MADLVGPEIFLILSELVVVLEHCPGKSYFLKGPVKLRRHPLLRNIGKKGFRVTNFDATLFPQLDLDLWFRTAWADKNEYINIINW